MIGSGPEWMIVWCTLEMACIPNGPIFAYKRGIGCLVRDDDLRSVPVVVVMKTAQRIFQTRCRRDRPFLHNSFPGRYSTQRCAVLMN